MNLASEMSFEFKYFDEFDFVFQIPSGYESGD